ncbi:Uncharacterized protein ycf54 [Apostasia shenzhenica]|uniref:Uncharacterized protein ycf54 n=1 Tax=Apostasia shenzhenica TaxID=1088818 RepID=A0A2I0ASQ8_9ASPA|nr:Uncharacterized protein ycf54 [Apostasia shenzhenica]
MIATRTLSVQSFTGFVPPGPGAVSSLFPGIAPHSRLVDLRLPTISKGIYKLGVLNAKHSSTPPRAVAIDSNELGFSQSADEVKPMKYHFLVANAKFMLDEEEHFKELLFERLRNYGERNKEQDFWLVIEPKFLDQFTNITNRLRRPAVALVSTNDRWITFSGHYPKADFEAITGWQRWGRSFSIMFMKLRLDRVLAGSYEAGTVEEALASSNVDLQFEKPEKWAAPYPKYEFGWWEPFLPPLSSKSQA